jgi:hypothetical protein
MMKASGLLVASLMSAALIAGACGGVTGGPRKVVFNETVCASARFLRMNLNETNRVVVDNRKHSDNQVSLGVTLVRFPVRVKGEVPPNSTIGDVLSTIVLGAPAGEEKSVDLLPTYTGTFTATCSISTKNQSGSQVQQTDIDVQIK